MGRNDFYREWIHRFFTAHSTVLFAIRKAWSRSWLTVTRVDAIIFSFGIFVAAGGVMLPTVITLSLATGRTDWRRPIRFVLFMLGLIIPGFIARDIGSDFGYGIATAGRIILFVLISCFVVAAARITAAPLADSWRMNRVLRIFLRLLFPSTGLVLFLASIGLSG